MKDARRVLAEAVEPRRRAAAEKERAAYEQYCGDLGIPIAADSVNLYLLAQPDQTGVQARARVARLDLAAHLIGEPPPSEDRVVRQFLRGTYSIHPLGPQMDLCEPLYPGDVRTLVDQMVQPGWQQLRDLAYLLTMNYSGLRWVEMNRLTWQDIRLGRNDVEIVTEIRKGRYGPRGVSVVLRRRRSRLLCPASALKALHAAGRPQPSRPVFSTRAGNVKSVRLRGIAQAVDLHREGAQHLGVATLDDAVLRQLAQPILRPLPISERDRLLVLVGFLGGLTPTEARNLRVGDMERTRRGLVLHLPQRPYPRVGLAARPGTPYCPRLAWDRWRRVLRDAGQDMPDAPVFVACDPFLPNLGRRPLSIQALTEVVAGRAARAGLLGHFTFSSLRDGLMRAAVLSGMPHHDIAAHVGHRTLIGIKARDLEESAMRRNILRLVAL